jgi:hypothetical protein
MGLKVFAFVRCLLFEHTCRELVLADDGWPAWSTKAFIRRPVMATPALDSAPVGHDPDNRARASDLNKLWHVSQEKKLVCHGGSGQQPCRTGQRISGGWAYLFVPAEQHAHRLASTLAAAAGVCL